MCFLSAAGGKTSPARSFFRQFRRKNRARSATTKDGRHSFLSKSVGLVPPENFVTGASASVGVFKAQGVA